MVTKLNLYGQFISRVRDNLHLVICMSPVGEEFRNRLRMFPSLVNCCTIDWFTARLPSPVSTPTKSPSTPNFVPFSSHFRHLIRCISAYETLS